jgi:beta-glucosidase
MLFFKGMKVMRIIKSFVLVLILTGSSICFASTILTDVDLNAIDKKVSKIVDSMTLDEKMLFMHGDKEGLKYDGPPPIERLNIPSYVIAHGPYGARVHTLNEQGRRVIMGGTFMSSSMNYAACWDPELVQRVGAGVGREIRAMGDHAVAGPAFNIVRDLRCGRSTEYFTEDPYLNARTSVPFVKGLQDEKVIATLKHYACNNQEFSRGSIDVQVSKRALHEIYLPGFEYAVTEADAMSVMSAYNKVNGKWCAENSYLLDDVLRKRWGFKGFVMSDWSGTHSTVDSVKAGLDLEMPRDNWYGKKLKDAVQSGEVSEKLIDERIGNILRTMFVAKLFDKDYQNPPREVFKSKEMKALALELALNSIVLLKNEDGVLPFNRSAVKKVAVIGPHSSYGKHFNEGKYDYTLFQEGGSANVAPVQKDMITPLEGIRELLGDAVEVVYTPGVYAENGCGPIASDYFISKDGKPGLSATYYNGNNFENAERSAVDQTVSFEWDKDPLVPEAGRPIGSSKKFSVRWEGKLNAPDSRKYTLELRFDGRAALYVDGKTVFEGNGNNDRWWHQVKLDLDKGPHDIKLEYKKTASKGAIKLWWDYENVAWIQKAVALAKSSDAVILNVGNSGNMEREGRDRFQGLQLSEAQEDLIKAVSAVNRKTAVVTFTAGVGMEDWIGGVPAVLGAMYPGEQAGTALAKLLFGEANPNGKLTVSIPKSVVQYPEGYWADNADHIEYTEGVFVGYRYFDEHNITPQFPFGHGLSYTTFEYGQPKINKTEAKIGENIVVSIDIKNTGKRPGAEVVQLYVHDVQSSVPRPPKELKAFKKVFLQPGETKTVKLELDKRAFAFFSESKDDWVVEPGEFELLFASSSRDIRQKKSIDLN